MMHSRNDAKHPVRPVDNVSARLSLDSLHVSLLMTWGHDDTMVSQDRSAWPTSVRNIVVSAEILAAETAADEVRFLSPHNFSDRNKPWKLHHGRSDNRSQLCRSVS
jgi:hypothetical protein